MHTEKEENENDIIFRKPGTADGKYLWALAKASKTLDVNSPYHYLILCRHFRHTCMIAERKGGIVGFVTAYIPPEIQDTLFIWQVAVAEQARGRKLGLNLIIHLFNQVKPRSIRHIASTITPSNTASVRLFTAVSRELGSSYTFEEEFFGASDFGPNAHEPEMLFRIGPITPA